MGVAGANARQLVSFEVSTMTRYDFAPEDDR
jgi:hypothetical protein